MTNFSKLTGGLALLSLTLAACNPMPAGPSYPAKAATVTTVTGSVSSWSRGAATARLTDDTGATTLASGSVNAAGQLTLTLPSGATVAPYLSAYTSADLSDGSGCTGSVTASDQQAGIFEMTSLDAVQNSVKVSELDPTTYSVVDNSDTRFEISINGRAWYYADRPVKLSGNVNCAVTGGALSAKLDVNLSPGWNAVGVTGSYVVTRDAESFSLNIHNENDGQSAWMEDTNFSMMSQGASTRTRAAELYALALDRVENVGR
ncbi:hypothetical protein [Deinococcus pimensis]|uniref:hypothetical protein n=1 Tax=Deinococcus pimensis TaxID=309888 RepID=UPI0005EB2262|nr:hypothetical protein [Deinococcus pimensis]